MIFKSYEEAETYFQDNFTQSDDVDKEVARFERWVEGQTIKEPGGFPLWLGMLIFLVLWAVVAYYNP